MVKRIAVFAYGVVSYLVFFATFCYAFGFVGNILVPKSIDAPREGSLLAALGIDLALLAVFAVQHSVMARPSFKRWITRWIPELAERPTYVLASSLALILLFWQWRPLGGVIWDVENPVGRGVLFALFVAGWLMVLGTTFLINHFDLFGLRHAWLALQGREHGSLRFRTPGPYQIIRHPLYVGWLMAFWATPTMTAAHLVFALGTTAYILAAIQLEERDLMAYHPEYAEYRRRVPMLVPRPGKRMVASEVGS